MAARHFSGNVPLSWQSLEPTAEESYVGRHFRGYEVASEPTPPVSDAHTAMPVSDPSLATSAEQYGPLDNDWAKAQIEAMFLELNDEMFGSGQKTVRSADVRGQAEPVLDEPELDETPILQHDIPDDMPELDEPLDEPLGEDVPEEPPLEATRELDPVVIEARIARRIEEEQVAERERHARLEVSVYPASDPSVSSPSIIRATRKRKRPLSLFAHIGESISRLLRLDER